MRYLRDRDSSSAAALVALRRDDLVVVRISQVHVIPPPSIEVACNVDLTADSSSGVLLGVADGPELLEGLGSIDGWSVDTGSLQDIVVGAVAVHGALLLGSRAEDTIKISGVTRQQSELGANLGL